MRTCRLCGAAYGRAYRRLHRIDGRDPTAIPTPRTAEVLEWAASGLSDKEIATTLGLDHRTIRSHLERYYDRTGYRGRAVAVAVWLLSGACGPERRARIKERLGLVAATTGARAAS